VGQTDEEHGDAGQAAPRVARMVYVRGSMLSALRSHGVVCGRGVGGGESEDDVGFG